MRFVLPIFFLLLSVSILKGQTQGEPVEGTVTFIASQNVYVKFSSTKNISVGDTLFVRSADKFIPVLKVSELSSISCVCSPVSNTELKVSDKVFFRGKISREVKKEETIPPVIVPPPTVQTDSMRANKPDTAATYITTGKKSRQQIHGFLSGASYTNWSNNTATNSQREKFTFGFNARNIGNSNFSAECYISYVLNDKQWNEVQNSVFNRLKIYNFSFNYDFGKKASLLIGRKINPKLSSMGPNDGLQFEMRFKPISFGIIAGFRPNYTDYGFNTSLFQMGAYLYNEYAGKKGFMQTTLAFINQTNSGKTDRRFFYLQHVNSLIKNLTFFGSVEVDMYGKNYNSADSTFTQNNSPKLSNLYLSLSYRVIRLLSVSFSYSNRQNVIYYETYKDILDRLLPSKALQGYVLQLTITPVTNLSLGATAGYRFMKEDPKPTKNLYVYVTYSSIPGIKMATTVSVTLLGTGYTNGRIYSAGISKDLASGKVFLGLTYRYVDYHYFNTEFTPTYQNMGEFNFTWRIIRKLALSLYYEGTFEQTNQYNRIYAQINWGF